MLARIGERKQEGGPVLGVSFTAFGDVCITTATAVELYDADSSGIAVSVPFTQFL